MTWPTYIPGEEAVAEAKAKEAEMQAAHGYGLFEGKDPWSGKVGEYVAARWAREHDLEVVVNGGYDDLPDLVINGWKCGVKCRSLELRHIADSYLLVPDRHLHKPYDFWLFLVMVNEPPHRTSFVGAVSPARFREVSHPWGPNYPAGALIPSSPWVCPPEHLLRVLREAPL
jgi:hypothetical protein